MDLNTIKDPIIRSTLHSLKKEIEDRQHLMSTQVLEDYASYRAELGYLHGLARSVVLIKDLLKDNATLEEKEDA